jgi:hypothetical protein
MGEKASKIPHFGDKSLKTPTFSIAITTPGNIFPSSKNNL